MVKGPLAISARTKSESPQKHSRAIEQCAVIFIAGLVLSRDEEAFLPHDFTSCANAILMKDCDVDLWQNQ